MADLTSSVTQTFLAVFCFAVSSVISAGEMGHSAHHQHGMQTELTRSTATYTVPNMTLYDQHGRAVSFAELLETDKPVMLNFIYTSCTAICPPLSATFSAVQRRLGKDASHIQMVSISIDPEHDTPQVLNDYARYFHAGEQWSFLTGTQQQAIVLQKAFDTYHGDKMNHTALTLLRSGASDEWVRFDGFASVAQLIKEVRSALSH